MIDCFLIEADVAVGETALISELTLQPATLAAANSAVYGEKNTMHVDACGFYKVQYEWCEHEKKRCDAVPLEKCVVIRELNEMNQK